MSLTDLDLPLAPPIARPAAVRARRRRGPAFALLGLGAVLVVGPVAGGLFSQAASGRQLLDAFRPHLEADALARYEQDLRTLRDGATAVDAVYAQQHVPAGRFPGIDAYRAQSDAIDDRAATLLDRVEASRSDYRQVDAIGGFDRIPFLLVVAGIAAGYGGAVLLTGSDSRARGAALVVVAASAALVAYPLLSNLVTGSRAGERMVKALAPVMTQQEVSQLQRDFVVVVTAEGQLDTSFRQVPRTGEPARALTAFGEQWPTISSDLATLVGTVNDNLVNYRALHDLDQATRPLGVSGLAAFPWALVAAGAGAAGLATAARPRTPKEHP